MQVLACRGQIDQWQGRGINVAPREKDMAKHHEAAVYVGPSASSRKANP